MAKLQHFWYLDLCKAWQLLLNSQLQGALQCRLDGAGMALQEHGASPTSVRCPSQARCKTAQSTQPCSPLVRLIPSERMLCYPLLVGLFVSRYCKQRLLERTWKGDLSLAQLRAFRSVRVVRAHPSALLLTKHTAVVWQGQTQSSRMCLELLNVFPGYLQ